MIIIKFAMVIFLFFLLYLVETTAERMQPKSGPNYYLDMADASVNPIQPEFRISKLEAMKHPHVFEVECYNNGAPYRVTVLENGVRKSSTYYYIDGYGRFRYVGYDDGSGFVRMRQISPEPKD